MITAPWCYAVAIPALRLTGLSKCGFGAGFDALATPLVAPVGVRVGVKLVPRSRLVRFYRLVYAGMFLTGAKLRWDGLK